MISPDFYAFGSKFLGAYYLERSAPPALLCFENGSIDTAAREMTIGETVISVGEFIDEIKLRKNNGGGGSKHAIGVQLVAEIKAYRWDENLAPSADPAQPQPGNEVADRSTPPPNHNKKAAKEERPEPEPEIEPPAAAEPDPAAQQIPITLPPSDPERRKPLEPLAAVLAAWENAIGVGQLGTLDQAIELAFHCADLNAALLAVAAMDDGKTVSNVLLARWLRNHNEVPIDGLMLSGSGVDENGSPLWTLVFEPVTTAAEERPNPTPAPPAEKKGPDFEAPPPPHICIYCRLD